MSKYGFKAGDNSNSALQKKLKEKGAGFLADNEYFKNVKVKYDKHGNLLLGPLIGEITQVLRSHYVDFLGVAAENFTEFRDNAMEAEDRTVNFDEAEYALLDDHWGNVFLAFCRQKGGKLKSTVADARIPPRDRKL